MKFDAILLFIFFLIFLKEIDSDEMAFVSVGTFFFSCVFTYQTAPCAPIPRALNEVYRFGT